MARTLFQFLTLWVCMAVGFFDDSAAKKLKAAAAQGKPIGVIKVSEEISLKAVLLPPAVVDRAFGKEIRNNYAVVHLTVSNKSRDAAFILHHVFLDYSSWFSVQGTSSDDESDNSINVSYTKRRQLGSVESRIVRAELQEAQNWTWRNLLVRGLKVTGSIAAAYTFATTNPSVAKGIASFNGNVVPGVEFLFPDPLIGQINRISDYGFRTPTVIPREDGTVIVAFFPLDRILTPSLKEAFLKSPAIFFNPELVAIDPKAQIMAEPFFKSIFAKGVEDFKKSVAAYEAALSDPEQRDKLNSASLQAFIKFMRSLSLENVRLGVEGVMVVDVRKVPASISGVEWGGNGSDFWLTPGKKTGKLAGRLLGGGEVTIKDAAALGIKTVKTVSVSQDGRTIDFEIEMGAAIESGAKLVFLVEKKDEAEQSVLSNEYIYQISYLKSIPLIKEVIWKSPALTVKGERFYSSASAERALVLKSKSEIVFRDFKSESDSSLEIDLGSLANGCYSVVVRSGTLDSLPAERKIAKIPQVKIKAAKLVADGIEVEWEEYPDLSGCSIRPKFMIETAGLSDIQLTGETKVDGKPNALKLLKPAVADDTWKIRIDLGDVKGLAAPITK